MNNSTWYCTSCKTDLNIDAFTPSEQKKGAPRNNRARCRTCLSEVARKWREDNPEKYREQMLSKARTFYSRHRKKVLVYAKEYQAKNQKIIKEKSKNWREKTRAIVFNHYGMACACCGESNYRFLSLDHINGGGNENRRDTGTTGGSNFYSYVIKAGFPDDLQTLCFNCNLGRHHNGGICPHKEGIHIVSEARSA